MERVTQLGYLGLSVKDVDEWERFAVDILGLQPNGRDEDGSLFLRMDEYHHRFTVHPDGRDDVAYLGWEVADEHACHALAEQLEAAGFEVSPGTAEEKAARRVAGLIRFQDPNGIPSEVFYGPLMSFEKPFQSPRPISGFRTGELGLGHFVILVDNAEQSIHFYRDVLGMRISDYVQITPAPGVSFQATFFHCNPRHHTIAFIESPKIARRRRVSPLSMAGEPARLMTRPGRSSCTPRAVSGAISACRPVWPGWSKNRSRHRERLCSTHDLVKRA